ncbi:MAG TPA: ABC transporter substrate-binding protein [Stellaceae bacterium]|jgi:putative ABC transport system substrate-binding protein
MRRRDLIAAAVGAAALRPMSAPAQHRQAVVGILSVFSAGPAALARLAAFRRGLAERGYVEGRNLTIEPRWAEHHYDRLPGFAADLVGRKVDLIATSGPPAARAAKRATATIPIVFSTGTDPVKDGFVASLARPGGNMTGISLLLGDLEPKRIELLSELVPKTKAIALLTNPTNRDVERVVNNAQHAAQARGFRFEVLQASRPSEIDAAFTAMSQRQVDALLVGIDTFFINRREQIVALAARNAVPAIYAFREFIAAGGLISYGIDIIAVYRQLGNYAGRILKGETPADLPVQQPTKFELLINLKTAKALGLTVPPTLLAQADEVIE